MATADEKRIHENDWVILRCTLCNQDLKKPKLLPCQHSFCTQCLVQYHESIDEGQSFCCPVCLKCIKLEVEVDTIEHFPDNYICDIYIEACKGVCLQKNICLSCSKINMTTYATHKCLDCGDTLCKTCEEWHCRFSSTKHHIVVSISDLHKGLFNAEYSKRKVLNCDEHSTMEQNIPMLSYCDGCRCLVCIECIQGDHKEHSVTKIHNVREKQQKIFDEKFLHLQRSQRDQDKRINNIEEAINDTKKKCSQHETEIHNTATELYALVDKVKEEKLTELKAHYKKEIKYLNDILIMEKRKQSSLQATVALAKMFLEKSSDSDFLHHEGDFTKRMESSQKGLSKSFKRQLVTFERQKTESVTQTIERVFGGIGTTDKDILHRCRIGQVKRIFKKNTDLEYIYGLTYNTSAKEILLVGETDDDGIYVTDEKGNYKRNIRCIWGLSSTISDIAVKNANIFYTIYKQNMAQIVMVDQKGLLTRKAVLPLDENDSKNPIRLAIGDNDTIYIASKFHNKIYRWDLNENSFQTFISKERGHALNYPSYMCFTPLCELVVSNNRSSNIQMYSKEGELLWQYDGKEEGSELKGPKGVCCDEDGHIYVVDKGNDRIHVLHDRKLLGIIPIDQERKSASRMPLIITPMGDLVYGHRDKVVKISFWE